MGFGRHPFYGENYNHILFFGLIPFPTYGLPSNSRSEVDTSVASLVKSFASIIINHRLCNMDSKI
uniref:Uncharacterized protein n=1 Tax=Arundo donax TaxID=35708 RepID=A0A0A9DVM0_ARUDO